VCVCWARDTGPIYSVSKRGETKKKLFLETGKCVHDISEPTTKGRNSILKESGSIDAIIIPPKLARDPKTSRDYGGVEQLR
jgi:hypothetical protein